MPVVPAAGYQTGPDAPQPVPLSPPEDYLRVQATPEAFGAQVGQSMSALGRVLTTSADEFRQVAMERQQLHNNVVSDKAINDFNDKANNLLYGDPNAVPGSPEAVGYYGLRGQAAIDAYPKMRAALQSSREAMRDQLENPMQQLAFDKDTRRQMSLEMGRAGIHYDQQYDVFQTETNKAGATLAKQQQERSVGDDAAFNDAVAAQMRYEYRQLQAQGLANDDNAIWAMQQRVRSEAVKTQIETYLGRNDTNSAARILNQQSGPGGALSAADAARYRTALSDANVSGAVDRAMGRGGGGGGGGAVGPPVQGPVTPEQVSQAATRNGVDPLLANATAAIESSHGANAGSPTKKYAGVYQMGPDERVSVGGNAGSIGSLEDQVEQGTKLLAKRKQELAAALGREPANWEVYLAHQQGVAGAVALINNPNTPAGKVISDVTNGREGAANISGNGGDPNAPASAFVQHWQQLYNQKEAQFKGVTPSAQPAAAAGGTTPSSGPIEVRGDSLGLGLKDRLGAAGTAVGGRTPTAIFDDIKTEPESHWQGKTVVLPSGSNGNQMPVVEETIKYLQDHGAKVIAVGYGPKFPEKNAQLAEIAGRLKVPVIAAEDVSPSEGVHPSPQGYQRMADKIRAAAGGGSAAGKPQTAAEGAIVTSPGKPPLQNVGGKWVPYMPAGL